MTVLYRVVISVLIIYNNLFPALYLVYQNVHSNSGTVFSLSFSIGGYPFCVSSTLSHALFLSPSKFLQFPLLFLFILVLLHFFFLVSNSMCPKTQLQLRTYSTIRNPCPAFSAKQITPSITVAVILPGFCLKFRTRISSYFRPLNPDK